MESSQNQWQLKWQGMWNSSNINKGQNWAINSNFNSLKNKYKNTIETKYNSTISKMTINQSNDLILKIDSLISDINNKNYTVSAKQSYTAMLSVLKDMLNQKISE